MRNIFTDLIQKLTRRQKKNKPVPVPPNPEPKPIRAVTYNRADGVVSGGLLQAGEIRVVESRPPLQQKPKGVEWDPVNKVYRGRTYNRKAQGDGFTLYADSAVFDDAFFEESRDSGFQSDSKPSESASGYDYPRETVSSAYVAPSPYYEAPTYTPSYSSGGSSTSSGYSGSSNSDSGYSSSSYSDSGSSSGGGYSGGE